MHYLRYLEILNINLNNDIEALPERVSHTKCKEYGLTRVLLAEQVIKWNGFCIIVCNRVFYCVIQQSVSTVIWSPITIILTNVCSFFVKYR
jgi:hypothetical protein